MSNPTSLPLHQKLPQSSTLQRALDIIIFFLLLSLLIYRLLSLNNHGVTWFLAFLCESWFTFIWVLNISSKWNPVRYKTYPERLVERGTELPPVDMFVTTADPVLEPPILMVNTVLSLLAVDYPADKLACYISDDGASALTFYALVESSKFAKLWVPFCKKYGVHVRAPFRYFSSKPISSRDASWEFQQAWRKMKDEYEKLSQKIEHAVQKSVPCDLTGEFAAFSNIDRRNHPSIIKVIWENKEGLSDGLPHLVYISREKRPKHSHHYKAGAMNVLTRVSGVMTNAPFMLNVDCDMFANNPQIVHHAMCLLLSFKNERESAFVQSPQIFYDGLKDDPYGNQFVVLQELLLGGMAGIQGPLYGGTGCFHRRKVIYGLSPDDAEIKGRILTSVNGKLTDEGLQKTFGNSIELTKSAAQILSGSNGKNYPHDLSSSVEAAYLVAGSSYEDGTSWGTKVGWVYGSTSEDVHTGLTIHARGWRSVYCSPEPPAFLGCAPSGGPASMTQQKRWATGYLEILFSKNSPFIATLTAKLQFRQALGYMWLLVWGLRSIPELCYAALPAYCLITNSHLFPKVQEPALFIYVALFVMYNASTLLDYLRAGLSIRAWWNNQRMGRITSATAWLFGFLSILLKLIGLSETVFEVTQKDQSTSSDVVDADAGRFTFDESPIFVPGTTVLLVHMIALVTCLLGFQLRTHGGYGSGVGEIMCSVWVVICFWSFGKGLFGEGKYGIPSFTIFKSVALSLLFVHFCKWSSMG